MKYFDPVELRKVFINAAIKTVSSTDVSKSAYVVTSDQVKVLDIAGLNPGIYPRTSIVPLYVIGTNEVIKASYYASQREGSGRSPEYRMGRFIDRLEVGNKLVLATDGLDVYICQAPIWDNKVDEPLLAYQETSERINRALDFNELKKRVRKISRKIERESAVKRTYPENPLIIEFARRRSGYKCEMPGCSFEGFPKKDGGKYIEVHHLISRSERPESSVFNVAALCPNCHRKIHYGVDCAELTKILTAAIKEINTKIKL